MAVRRARAEWERLVHEVERGASVAEVARRHGVSPRLLTWWRWHLRRGTVARSATKAKPVQMVPVRVLSEPHTVVQVEEPVEVVVRGAVLRIRVGQDPRYIAELAAALAARC